MLNIFFDIVGFIMLFAALASMIFAVYGLMWIIWAALHDKF